MQSRCYRREAAESRKISRLACASPIGTSALTSSAGSPFTTSCKKSRLKCYVPTGTPTTLIPCRTTVSPVPTITVRCSSVRRFGPTPSASRACDFPRFKRDAFYPRRFCSHSATFPVAAMSRESSGGRVTVMSSMNETALAKP